MTHYQVMTHYQALEVATTATAADIRQAYRRLVFLTHPDRTPDPAAHARYLVINAAYRVLSDPSRRFAYDAGLQPRATAPRPISPGRPRESAHRAEWASRRRRTPTRFAVRYAAHYARAVRWARPLLLASLVLCASLAVDLWLATERVEQVLGTETVLHYTRWGSYETTRYQTDRGSFAISDELPVGQMVVRRTPLWRTAIWARFSPSQSVLTFSSVYKGKRYFFWLGLLATATLGLAPRLSNEHRLLACLAAAVFLGLTLVQMFR